MKSKPNIKLKQINHGIAFYIIDGDDSWIEVNKNLFDDSKLLNEVIDHEIEHSKATTWPQQYWIDFKDSWNLPKQFRLTLWQLKHPESFTNMLPILFKRKRVSVNWYATSFWFLILLYIVLLIYQMGRF